MNFLLAFLGGGTGSLLRYVLIQWTGKEHAHYCTMSINIVSCFIIGILAGIIIYKSGINKNMAALLMTGFCGGFSTLSAYSLDIISMYKSGNYLTATLYMILTVALSLATTALGIFIISKT